MACLDESGNAGSLYWLVFITPIIGIFPPESSDQTIVCVYTLNANLVISESSDQYSHSKLASSIDSNRAKRFAINRNQIFQLLDFFSVRRSFAMKIWIPNSIGATNWRNIIGTFNSGSFWCKLWCQTTSNPVGWAGRSVCIKFQFNFFQFIGKLHIMKFRMCNFECGTKTPNHTTQSAIRLESWAFLIKLRAKFCKVFAERQ